MTNPRIAHRKGYYFEVKAGQRYFWCSCGRSANQPFCDGSHAGSGFQPVLFEATADEDVIFCGCKHTGTRPFCDGTHNNLPGATAPDDPNSSANRTIKEVLHDVGPEVQLDGACYVFAPARARLTRCGTMNYCPAVTPARGSLYQSQFYAEFAEGTSPVIGAGGHHIVLFVTAGQGEVEISGQRFRFGPESGIYVHPDEAFRVHNKGPDRVKLFISVGPGIEKLTFRDQMPGNFNAAFPERLAHVDPALKHAMGQRYFQILVNRDHGSTMMTQFIGNIPFSKAEPHRHLYEEVLFFLNGTGVVWTETRKTRVGPGDVLFLPRKLAHSVQCTSLSGLDVVGVIYPGDNPSISF